MIHSVQCEDRVFTVIDRIQGNILEQAWLSLGWYATCRLALQLRRFMHTLRSVTSTTAGSLVTGECRSFWLDDHFGLPPKAKPEDVSAFLAFWTGFISIRQELQKSDHQNSSLTAFADFQSNSLVFTHHDLAPRNLLVDSPGVSLIDWNYAGFYPICFEYASMNNFIVPRSWGLLS